MNDSFNNLQQGQQLFFSNATSGPGTANSGAGTSTGASTSVSDPQSSNTPNLHNSNSTNHANSVLNNTRASTSSNSNHHVDTDDHTNGHMLVRNNQLRTSRHASNESINPENEPMEMNPSSNTLTGQPSSSDFYQLIGQLQQQNNINNQLVMKINYLSDSVDEVKRSLLEIQQLVYTLQNGGQTSAMGGPFVGNINNQFKAFEVFTKHLTKLNKEIEAINGQALGGVPSVAQQPQLQNLRQHLSQQHQPPPSQPHVNPELLSQSHMNVTNNNTISHENHHNLHQNQNQNQNQLSNNQAFDDEADLGRKNLGLRSPGVNSNSTSPYVFELGPFSTARNHLNGNINYEKSPMSLAQISHQLKRSQQGKHSLMSSTQPPQQQLQTMPQHQSHLAQPGQSQRPPVLAQHPQQQQLHANSTQATHTQQTPNSYSNSYMLPVPPLLHDDKTGALTHGNDSSSQYLLSRDNSGLLTSALRQQASHTRSIPAQTNTAFSFDDNDIEQSIGELEQQAGSSAGNGHNAPTNNAEGNNLHKHPSKKRKIASDIKSGDIEETEIPQYKLERSLKLIADIWKEYAYGVNGKPPLKSLEAKYGTKWRNETESRTFLRRKKIYEAIEVGKSKGYSEDDVILELEDYRSFEKNGSLKKRPLLWMSSNIPAKFTEPEDE